MSESIPFLNIERIAELPKSGGFSELLRGYDAFIIPCEAFLEMEAADRPAPAIVHGSCDAALTCFEAGAADFMRSGWALPELGARLYRLWQPSFDFGGNTIALRGSTLSSRGREADSPVFSCVLTPKEAAILRALFAAPGKVISAHALRGCARLPETRSRSLGMQILRLRGKLAGVHPLLAPCLKSVRGGGYSWCP